MLYCQLFACSADVAVKSTLPNNTNVTRALGIIRLQLEAYIPRRLRYFKGKDNLSPRSSRYDDRRRLSPNLCLIVLLHGTLLSMWPTSTVNLIRVRSEDTMQA